MNVTRLDLDGTGSPSGLVSKILQAEPGLSIPVPIEALALQLDIMEIRDLPAEKFEGGLITDTVRSSGFILVNDASRGGRRRFTIGHELGHFLMLSHMPPPEGFLCSRADMHRWEGKDKSPAIRMEVEANEFASLILMPPPHWRKHLESFRDPDLSQVVDLAERFKVSKEAAARAYAQYHDEPVAVAIVKDGKIERVYRNITRFPRLGVQKGSPVPRTSQLFRQKQTVDLSPIVEAQAELWLDTEWGKPFPNLYEQVLRQQNGFALILLWTEVVEADDEEDQWANKTSKERYREQGERWGR